jgi:hypothetical protein
MLRNISPMLSPTKERKVLLTNRNLEIKIK